MVLSVTGLGSGLDINSLVNELVAAERSTSDLQLSRQSEKLTTKFSALGSLKGALAEFQPALASLNTLGNFSRNSASVSDTSSLTVTASPSAIPSSYTVEVANLAESHALASTAYADVDTTSIGTGSLTFRFGTTDYVEGTDTYNSFALNADKNAATITVDSSNNTLQGLMTSINNADIGVDATIVNDGSGFRLLLSSSDTGAANSMEIVVDDDDLTDTDTSGLSNFAFNGATANSTNLEQTVAGADASLTINGLAVSAASNTLNSTIPGATLNLKSVTSEPVSVTIAPDVASTRAIINSFIEGYNSYIAVANELSAYDAETDQAAALVGDYTLRSINSQIDAILRTAVPGLGGDYSSLSTIGITTNADGSLRLDNSKLDEALDADISNVTKLFAALGEPSDGDISYVGATDATTFGNYAVEVTALASQGEITGAANFIGGLEIDELNNNFDIEVDGINAGTISLTAGTYADGNALANELQVQINGAAALVSSGNRVSVTYSGGSFTITSATVGSASSVNITGVDTNTLAELGLGVASGIAGVDVQGTINGLAATGNGNVLTAAAGSDAEGLSIAIEGGATGSRGSVSFTRGVADQLGDLLDAVLATGGALESRIDNYESRLDELVERSAELDLRWQAVEARYLQQFNALDALIANLNTTSTFLEQQFASLVKPQSTGSNN